MRNSKLRGVRSSESITNGLQQIANSLLPITNSLLNWFNEYLSFPNATWEEDRLI